MQIRNRLLVVRQVVFGAMLVWLPWAYAESPEALTDPIPDAITVGEIQVRLVPVVSQIPMPFFAVPLPEQPEQLVVIERQGGIWQLDTRSAEARRVLDLSAQTSLITASEAGLLGLSFAPDFAEQGYLYTHHSSAVDAAADLSSLMPGESAAHHAVIIEWSASIEDGQLSIEARSARELLRIDQPQNNHNGGSLNIDPLGYLYISLGDGGSSDDQGPGHSAIGNAQDLTNPLGAILRIDPNGRDSANGQYGIPASNPLVGTGMVEEIWAWGFRNPFRSSFDSMDHSALWVADVGQGDIEEISQVRAGENHGWNLKEGSYGFFANDDGPGYVFDPQGADLPATLIDPIAEYDHDEGNAVIGGYVYRGQEIAELTGRYLFGDFGGSNRSAGRLFYLSENNQILGLQLLNAAGEPSEMEGLLLGIAQDGAGELYVMVTDPALPGMSRISRLAAAEQPTTEITSSSGGSSGIDLGLLLLFLAAGLRRSQLS